MDARLRSERDTELEAVVARLQEDQQAERAAAQAQHSKQLEQRDRQHAEEVKGTLGSPMAWYCHKYNAQIS